MIGLSKTTGITSMEQWLASKRVVKSAASALALPRTIFQSTCSHDRSSPPSRGWLQGYSEVRLAFNSGEIEGICNAWESFKSTWRKELDANEVTLVLQAIPTRHR